MASRIHPEYPSRPYAGWHEDPVGASFRAAIVCQRRLFLELVRAAQSDRGKPGYAHRHFLLLYFLTTDMWIRYARMSSRSEFICDLVGAFYWIYDESIGRYLRTGRCDRRYGHWTAYYRSVRALAQRGGALCVIRTIYCGARAHTRYDLRDAIVRTYRTRLDRNLSVPSAAELENELFGEHSDQLFRSVFERFRHETLSAGRSSLRPRLVAGLSRGLAVVGPVWIKLFQRWRRQAFAEAMTELGVLYSGDRAG